MSNTINFSIDLGTTNSVIARFSEGSVDVFKNPMGLKETLPSVVAFKNERVLVGDKARELMERDPQNVASLFKRKMGTTETYHIEKLNKDLTPVELSSYVLKELKNFVSDSKVEDVVITIPASFDTVQSNATQKAGEMAGFRSVTLLQEPIAASLAFANKSGLDKDSSGYWVVYDLGGGTFDVALVKFDDGEMNVVDHAGDNFLGGTDFDQVIIEKIIVPRLETKGAFTNLLSEMKSAAGKHNKLFYKLQYLCEEVKIQLSSMEVTDVEFEVEDDNGKLIEFYTEIKRSEFEEVIEASVRNTVKFITKLLADNNLDYSQINKVLMIGGSTYIPLVRKLISEESGGKVDYTVDPTSAVAVGAGFYAGSKTIPKVEQEKEKAIISNDGVEPLKIKTAFQKQTQQNEEYFVAKIDGDVDGLTYRITRKDGGFDSGNKSLKSQVEEDLPLIEGVNNDFSFKIYDQHNNQVNANFDDFSIVQGKFGVLGQPLPADICLEVDDVEEKETRLEVVFEKNAVLPLKKLIVKEVGTTITQGSKEELIINILEGRQYSSPASNKPIGVIKISGKELERDLLKGTDVEIKIHMTESRELKVFTYLSMTGQEFENVFTPSDRYVDTAKLRVEVEQLVEKARNEKVDLEYREEYKKAQEVKNIEDSATELFLQMVSMPDDDVTDAKFQIEDAKRELWYKLDELTNNKKLSTILKDLHDNKKDCQESIERIGLDAEKQQFEALIAQEKSTIESGNSSKIKSLTEQFRNLQMRCQWKDPEYVKNVYYFFKFQPMENYKNTKDAEKLFSRGDKAVEKDRIDELKAVVNALNHLYKDSDGEDFSNRTGLV